MSATFCVKNRTTWTLGESRTMPVTKFPADMPLEAQASTPLEDADNLFLRHAAAEPPTLNVEEVTAVRANSSLDQQHEVVAAACLRPLG